jgi:hypothetical protein
MLAKANGKSGATTTTLPHTMLYTPAASNHQRIQGRVKLLVVVSLTKIA